jgi:S1-C subfamily serine protease
LIRLDVGIYDGFSGGPLVSARGRVLGINTSALSRGSAISIPASTVDRVSEQLSRDGRVARGYVGLGMQPVRLSTAMAAKAESPDGIGLMVVSVDNGGPADAAGVFLGDVLVSFDGTAVSDPAQLLALLGSDAIGQRKEVRIVRAGQIMTVGITIGDRPADRPRGRRE